MSEREPYVSYDDLKAENEAFIAGFQLAADNTGYVGDWFASGPIVALINDKVQLAQERDKLKAENARLKEDIERYEGSGHGSLAALGEAKDEITALKEQSIYTNKLHAHLLQVAADEIKALKEELRLRKICFG